ncbi:hypothetical protein JTB14_019193 [Gonioctena quinquepunctata]|nr:hypothetical protein JTB14_019193 [Gonioctena quinquepunctata]
MQEEIKTGSILVIIGCDWTKNEAQKMVSLCFKCQKSYPFFSKERKEFENLTFEFISNKIVFNAAGFFEIDIGTIPALLETAVSYFLVLIQFN